MHERPIQCMCGWWPPTTPQNLWTKQEWESVVAHQQAHIREDERMCALSGVGEGKIATEETK